MVSSADDGSHFPPGVEGLARKGDVGAMLAIGVGAVAVGIAGGAEGREEKLEALLMSLVIPLPWGGELKPVNGGSGLSAC